MQNHNFLFKIFAIPLCILMANCASTNTPHHWLNEPRETALDVYGGWIDVRSRGSQIAGELIAISEDTVFVANTMLHAVASEDIVSARLVIYDAAGMGWIVFGGTLSTISNGLFLIFTAPMWLIGGPIAAISRSYEPIVDYPQKSLEHFKPFARFPQGLPSGVDRDAIRTKDAH